MISNSPEKKYYNFYHKCPELIQENAEETRVNLKAKIIEKIREKFCKYFGSLGR